MKNFFSLLFTIFILIVIITLIKKTQDWYWTLLLIVPISTIYKDKTNEFYDQVKALLGESDWKYSQRKLKISGKLQEDSKIRISFAYLFRIKVDGKYFLVVNKRTGKYQPVGGAYKLYDAEAQYLSKNLPAESDDCIPVDEVTKMDYRLIIKNKDLKYFMIRFDKTKNRENIEDLSREFIEEVFTSNILNRNEFGDLTYHYCGRHITGIEKSPFNKFEVLLADIVQIDLSQNQEQLFRELVGKCSKLYKFATPDEINRLGIKIGSQDLQENIANHTFKVLIENNNQLKKGIRYKYKYRLPITIPL